MIDRVQRFIEAIKANFKALKTVRKISKNFFMVSLINTIFCSLEPYIIIYMSGTIISLVVENDGTNMQVKKIFMAIGFTIVSTLLISSIKLITESRKKILESSFYTAYEIYINELSNKVDYETFEKEEFAVLKETVRRGNDDDVYGIPLTSEVICDLLQGVISSVIAVAMSIQVLAKSFLHGEMPTSLSFVSSPWGALFLVLIFVVAGVVSVNIEKKTEAYKNSYASKFASLRNYREYMLYHCLTEEHGGKEIRMHGMKDFVMNEIETNYRTPMKGIYGKIGKAELKRNFVIKGIMIGLESFSYIYVGLMAMAKAIRVGDIVICYGALSRMMQSFLKVSTASIRFVTNADYVMMFQDYEKRCELNTKCGEKVSIDINEKVMISFEHVCFRYPGSNKNVLNDINITFESGQKCAIVGMNGAGKTTLIKLLCRLYKPTEGVIKLNGIDVNNYDLESYYKLISVSFQDFYLLAFSVGQNVATSVEYNDGDVYEALEVANMKDRVLTLKEGLDQCISKDFDSDGVDFSGGEYQKIAIARSFYKQAPIFVLDEPTAALDPISESEIYDGLARMIKDKVAVFISHRLSCCTLCDKVIVMDNGSIVQYGEHKELLQDLTGLYLILWNKQACYYI